MMRTSRARLFAQLAQQPVLEVLARLEPAGRHLRASVGMVAVVEDEQLLPPVALARDVREHRGRCSSRLGAHLGLVLRPAAW